MTVATDVTATGTDGTAVNVTHSIHGGVDVAMSVGGGVSGRTLCAADRGGSYQLLLLCQWPSSRRCFRRRRARRLRPCISLCGGLVLPYPTRAPSLGIPPTPSGSAVASPSQCGAAAAGCGGRCR